MESGASACFLSVCPYLTSSCFSFVLLSVWGGVITGSTKMEEDIRREGTAEGSSKDVPNSILPVYPHIFYLKSSACHPCLCSEYCCHS